MPAKPGKRKHSYDKKRSKVGTAASVSQPPVTAPAAPAVAPPEKAKTPASPVTTEEPTSIYTNVGRELKRTAVITGIVLAILVMLFVFLR
ncbi:MAG: hypothetical protein ABIB93_02135 [Chloroflexota bacterium]